MKWKGWAVDQEEIGETVHESLGAWHQPLTNKEEMIMGISDSLREAQAGLEEGLSWYKEIYSREIIGAMEGLVHLMEFIRLTPGLDRPPDTERPISKEEDAQFYKD